MSYTTTQLATAVLRHLGVADATETPDATDNTFVVDTWAQKWEELSAHGNELTYFPYTEIPNPVFLICRDLVANECKTAFGIPQSVAEKENEEIVILRRLRRHLAQQATGLPGTASYL